MSSGCLIYRQQFLQAAASANFMQCTKAMCTDFVIFLSLGVCIVLHACIRHIICLLVQDGSDVHGSFWDSRLLIFCHHTVSVGASLLTPLFLLAKDCSDMHAADRVLSLFVGVCSVCKEQSISPYQH